MLNKFQNSLNKNTILVFERIYNNNNNNKKTLLNLQCTAN